MHQLAGLDGVEGALLLEWWLISAAFQDSCGSHDTHPTAKLKCLNFGRWPDTPRSNTSSFRQFEQESARERRQRPAANRSQQSVDGVVVLHGRRRFWRNVWRLTAAACARKAAHSDTVKKGMSQSCERWLTQKVFSVHLHKNAFTPSQQECYLIHTASEKSCQDKGCVMLSHRPVRKHGCSFLSVGKCSLPQKDQRSIPHRNMASPSSSLPPLSFTYTTSIVEHCGHG